MKIKVFGRSKTCQLSHIFNTLCHDFQCNIVQTASVKIHLKWVSFQCCCKYTSISFAVKPIDKVCFELNSAFALAMELKESLNVLNKRCLFESCTFSLWYSLKHLKVLEKNSFDSWQYKKVCSTETGLRQNGHSSSEPNLYSHPDQTIVSRRHYSLLS